jgi:FMN phosphatase YigB (HAD superfamily)
MKHYKTVLIDFDGTLLDTSIMPQYSANVRQYKRYGPEWHHFFRYLGQLLCFWPFEFGTFWNDT